MTRPVAPAKRASLGSVEVQLYVAGIEAATAFYTDKLGFKIAFVYGDPPFYAQVHRGKARVNLRVVGEPVYAGDVREREQLLSATVVVKTAAEIKQLFLEFQSAGVPFARVLKKEPWGARTFTVRDPDGNFVLFAGPAE